MQLRSTLGDARSNRQGLLRPRSGAHQNCGTWIPPTEHRVGLLSIPATSKPWSAPRTTSWSVSSGDSAGEEMCVNKRLEEQELFVFEDCEQAETRRDAQKSEARECFGVDDEELIGAGFDERLGRNHKSLPVFGFQNIRMDLKDTSSPVDIPNATRRGGGCLSMGLSSEGWRGGAAVNSSMPVNIPQVKRRQVEIIDREEPSSGEAFMPPHIFLARMNKDPLQASHTCRPRGLSSLRLRTAVLTETGYFDGYTEIGQKPSKDPVGEEGVKQSA